MAEYLHPGVFIEEKPSGARPIEAASTSTACFTGTVARGRPGFPTFVSSWFQFKDAFGDLDKNHDLPLAVYQFFQNGGSRAYILRVVAADATFAKTAMELQLADGTRQNVTINAAGAGAWGNGITVTVAETKSDVMAAAAVVAENLRRGGVNPLPVPPIHFDIQVSLDGQVVERWASLDGTEDGDKFYASVINRYSNYITIEPGADGEFVQGKPTFVAAAATGGAAGTPAAGTPAAGTGTPAAGTPAAGTGTPAAGTPAAGTRTPAAGTPAAGTSAAGTSAAGTPAAGTPAAGTPAAGTSPAAGATPAAPAATALTVPKQVVIGLSGGTDGAADPIASDFGNALATLDRSTDVSLLVVPGVTADIAAVAASYVSERAARPGVGGDMFFIMDPPRGDEWNFGPRDARSSAAQIAAITRFCQTFSPKDTYSALYFPWVEIPDPYSKVTGATRFAPPSGMIAGMFARTDNSRGVWKAPAGTEATMLGAVGVAAQVSDQDQDTLNPIGVNCIRQFAASGIVCWGTRTLGTLSNPEYRYVPIRRTANFLKTSLYRGTQWVVFEPNDEPLWAAIRFNVTAFMSSLFRAGAFQGTKPEDAFFVKCDKDNNTQATIDQGQVHILVGFAPLKPAEFVIITLQQIINQ